MPLPTMLSNPTEATPDQRAQFIREVRNYCIQQRSLPQAEQALPPIDYQRAVILAIQAEREAIRLSGRRRTTPGDTHTSTPLDDDY